MLRILEGFSATITKTPVTQADTVMTVKREAGLLMLNSLAVGDVVYLRMSDYRGQEVVKYTHTGALPATSVVTLVVERGSMGTAVRSWPCGTCMHTSLSEGVLTAFVCQTIQNC